MNAAHFGGSFRFVSSTGVENTGEGSFGGGGMATRMQFGCLMMVSKEQTRNATEWSPGEASDDQTARWMWFNNKYFPLCNTRGQPSSPFAESSRFLFYCFKSCRKKLISKVKIEASSSRR